MTIYGVYRGWSEKDKTFSEQQLAGRESLVNAKSQRKISRRVKVITVVTSKMCRRASLNEQHAEP